MKAPNIAFVGVRLERGSIKFRNGGDDGLVDNIRGRFANISLLGGDRVTVQNSKLTDNEEWDFFMIGLGSDDALIIGNDTDKNSEVDRTDDDHADCIEIVGPDERVRVIDNVFTDCDHAAMELVSVRGPINDVLVEGNFFRECRVLTTSCYAVYGAKINDGQTVLKGPGGYPMTNVKVRGNMFDGGPILKVTRSVELTDNQMSAGQRSSALEVYDRCTDHSIRGNTIESVYGRNCDGLGLLNTFGPTACAPAPRCGVDPRSGATP